MDPQTTAPMQKASSLTMWPGAFGIYKFSRDAIRLNFWLLFQLIVVYFAALILLSLVHVRLVSGLLMYIVAFVFSVTLTRTLIAGVRGKALKASQLLTDDVPMLALKQFALSLLTSLAAAISLVLFIIPAFFVIPRLTLANYFLVDKNMGVFDAFSASWNATKGNVGKVYGIIGVEFLICLLVATVIGIPFALYFAIMYMGANAVLYEYASHKAATAPAAPTTPTA